MSKVSLDYQPLSRASSEYYGHINFLYQNIEPSDYTYELLVQENMNQISPDKNLVCLNATKKSRFFLVFNNFKGINQALLIAYGRHCSSSQVWVLHIQAKEDLFLGTIMDGDLVEDNRGELSFVISDLYLLRGVDLKCVNLDEKPQMLDVEDVFLYNPHLTKVNFQWNPLFTCEQIEASLQHSDVNFDFNGIMFVPKISGKRWIYRINNKQQESVQQKLPDYDVGEKKVFTIEQNELPDVYPISANQLDYGHLYIPTKTVSLKVRGWVQKGPVAVNCQYDGKKWVPKSLSKC
jgi:hypothetical protein